MLVGGAGTGEVVPYVGDTLQPQDLEVASAAILQACDALDGLVDGIVDNYTACTGERVNKAFAFASSRRPRTNR